MRAHRLVAILFTFLIFSTSCQKDIKKQIIGTWEIVGSRIENLDKYLDQFKDKYQASDEEIQREESRVQSLPEAYYPDGITMSFKEGGVYDLGGITGKWTYDKDKNQITVSLTTLDKSNFIVKKVTRNKLILVYPFKMSGVDLNFELTLQRVKEE